MGTKNEMSKKFQIARESLGLAQHQLAAEVGFKQPNISAQENRGYTRVHVSVLMYFFKHGIDLNAMFNPDIDDNEFLRICRRGVVHMLPLPAEGQPTSVQECQQCKVKDRMIEQMDKQIVRLENYIDRIEPSGNKKAGQDVSGD